MALKSEEEQAREKAERDRRDARRKSLANRRVSFAAEATLHTFHELDFNVDSTASTDSSRHASSMKNQAPAVGGAPHAPIQNRSLTQKDRDDNTANSGFSSDSEAADAVEEIAEDEDESSSTNSDDEDGTMMTVDDITGTTMGSDRTSMSNQDSSTLEQALRQAAQRAGRQNRGEEPDYDEDDDDGEEVIPSFGWIKKDKPAAAPPPSDPVQSQPQNSLLDEDTGMDMDMDTEMDMDMTGAVGGILKHQENEELNQTQDMSMDVTTAFGGILGHAAEATVHEEQDDISVAANRISTGEEDDDTDENEDMSMELTAVLGGALGNKRRRSSAVSRRSMINGSPDEDQSIMEMTMGIGKILSGVQEEPEDVDDEDDEATMGMDLTVALGSVMKSGGGPSPKTLGKRTMVEEGNQPGSTKDAIEAAFAQGSPTRRRSSVVSAREPETDKEDLWAFQGKSLRRSVGVKASAVTKSPRRSRTPSPAKQATPEMFSSPMAFSPIKPPAGTAATQSPKAQTRRNTRTPSPPKRAGLRRSLFESDPKSGQKTPAVVLTPQKRRLSGQGVDRQGLGSPRVTEMFDRRGSIGESAEAFVAGKRAVAFGEPQIVVNEANQWEDNESDQDEEGEHNLREMIDNMSPKKNYLKGRKSLHVGSASGLLGKRPVELDSDEEDEDEQDGVKRLKGHQASPVRNVRLQPPSVTTGRLGKSNMLSPGRPTTPPSLSSPIKKGATSPRGRGPSKDERKNQTVHNLNFDGKGANDESDEDRIHLQDFLNMTSIRFMELNTTKRRHTVAPAAFKRGDDDEEDEMSLEKCVVAGACTIPMLELYQHSCRELKKYISEGRRMVKEIEFDTFEENPPLFQEYITATAAVKAVMDNQFKNVRSHSRLLSKAMWYEWRMKLQEGLKDGLDHIADGLDADDKVLSEQQSLLSSVLPSIIEKHGGLTEECKLLEEAAQELANCDPEELQSARDELESLSEDIEDKKKQVAELRKQFAASETEVEDLKSRKATCLSDIENSEKIREECRGWTSQEVNGLKGKFPP